MMQIWEAVGVFSEHKKEPSSAQKKIVWLKKIELYLYSYILMTGYVSVYSVQACAS